MARGTAGRSRSAWPRACAGAAWAGDLSVSKVDVSTDFGASWQRAKLEKPKNKYDWQRWTATVKPPVFLTSTFVFQSAEEGRDFFDYTSGRREPPACAGRCAAARRSPGCGPRRSTAPSGGCPGPARHGTRWWAARPHPARLPALADLSLRRGPLLPHQPPDAGVGQRAGAARAEAQAVPPRPGGGGTACRPDPSPRAVTAGRSVAADPSRAGRPASHAA